MLPNYEQLIEKIASASGLSKEEVDSKVEAKCAKLSGLISKEGSAQIVASELGVSFEKEKLKVSELVSGMSRLAIVGKIVSTGTPREFTTQGGKASKVLSLTLADSTGSIRTVLWDVNHIAKFEKNEFKEGDVVEISNASVRNEELHLGSFSEIKKSSEKIDGVVVSTSTKMTEKNILDLKAGDSAKVRGILVQMFEPKFFEVCPECGKKAVDKKCAVHGDIHPKKKALIGVVIDDGTENMRGVLFGEQISQLGVSDEELDVPELFLKKKESLLGHEAFFSCQVRNNKLFNTTELIVTGVENIELDSLIASLK
jgi:hypothetical protein